MQDDEKFLERKKKISSINGVKCHFKILGNFFLNIGDTKIACVKNGRRILSMIYQNGY